MNMIDDKGSSAPKTHDIETGCVKSWTGMWGVVDGIAHDEFSFTRWNFCILEDRCTGARIIWQDAE